MRPFKEIQRVMTDNVGTVSYTHLDVYKRQIMLMFQQFAFYFSRGENAFGSSQGFEDLPRILQQRNSLFHGFFVLRFSRRVFKTHHIHCRQAQFDSEAAAFHHQLQLSLIHI